MKKCDYGFLFLLLNTAILGAVAGLSHFAYPLSGESAIVGLFNPVNESVWEHLKFMFFPNLIWWIVVYFIKRKECGISTRNWIVASSVSLVTAPLWVLLLFYAYTGASGAESVIVDIALTFICYFLALALAFHVYKHAKPSAALAAVSVLAVILLFLSFIVFTFCPPHIPLFLDPNTGTYGIG